MNISDIVNGFIIDNKSPFSINYDGSKLDATVTNKEKMTTTKYTTDLVPIKHEAFTRGTCGVVNKGYCHNNRACNNDGVCGSFETHYKQDGLNSRYRLCKSDVDPMLERNCVDRIMCNSKNECVPVFRL